MRIRLLTASLLCLAASSSNAAKAQEASTQNSERPPGPLPDVAQPPEKDLPSPPPNWSWHVQNTAVAQGDPGFAAKYSGLQSLNPSGELRETVTLDLFAGVRLWHGAEMHVDGLMWQGFGLSKTMGIEGFPNGDAYKAGTAAPNFTFSRLFIRQIIELNDEVENTPGDALTLAGKRNVSRLTFTIGRFTPTDICDNNRYAHDPHTQFMNWAMMSNLAWDYGQDTVGYTTGLAVELNRPGWALRYTFFQMPHDKNGFTGDDRLLMWPRRGAYGPFLRAWAMASEFERRYRVKDHPAAIRFLAWADRANFASYRAATSILSLEGAGADISVARAYRHKYGFGVNWEQEINKSLGVFSRIGWNDGHNETWTFTDANWSASLGAAIKGRTWRRADDTLGIGGVASGISRDNERFLEAGGLDILDGDGALTYGCEKIVEAYYDFKVWRTTHATVDYQHVVNLAFNRDRGPVSILGARLHWEF